MTMCLPAAGSGQRLHCACRTAATRKQMALQPRACRTAGCSDEEALHPRAAARARRLHRASPPSAPRARKQGGGESAKHRANDPYCCCRFFMSTRVVQTCAVTYHRLSTTHPSPPPTLEEADPQWRQTKGILSEDDQSATLWRSADCSTACNGAAGGGDHGQRCALFQAARDCRRTGRGAGNGRPASSATTSGATPQRIATAAPARWLAAMALASAGSTRSTIAL